jgi:hypothetical protein
MQVIPAPKVCIPQESRGTRTTRKKEKIGTLEFAQPAHFLAFLPFLVS